MASSAVTCSRSVLSALRSNTLVSTRQLVIVLSCGVAAAGADPPVAGLTAANPRTPCSHRHRRAGRTDPVVPGRPRHAGSAARQSLAAKLEKPSAGRLPQHVAPPV